MQLASELAMQYSNRWMLPVVDLAWLGVITFVSTGPGCIPSVFFLQADQRLPALGMRRSVRQVPYLMTYSSSWLVFIL